MGSEDHELRGLRRSQRERKENRAWSPSLRQKPPPRFVDPDEETCEDSELGDGEHTSARNFAERSSLREEDRRSPELSSSDGSPKEEESSEDESDLRSLEDEGREGVLGDAAASAEDDYQALKAHLEAQVQSQLAAAEKKRDAARLRVSQATNAPGSKKSSQRASQGKDPAGMNRARPERPKSTPSMDQSLTDRGRDGGLQGGGAGGKKARPKMKPLYTPPGKKSVDNTEKLPKASEKEKLKRPRAESKSARELELEEELRKQKRQLADLTNKVNSGRPALPPDMDNQWGRWYGGPGAFPPFWQAPPASTHASPTAPNLNAVQPTAAGNPAAPTVLFTSANVNFIGKIISEYYKSTDREATFYPEDHAFIKTKMEKELAQSPSDPQWQMLWTPRGAFSKAAATKIINQRSNQATKIKEGIIKYYAPPHYATRDFIDFAEKEASGAAYRKEPEPGVDPFGRKEYLETLGFAFVTNWASLPEQTRIKELKLNVQQVALAEAVFWVCFGYDGNVGNMKELPKSGLMASMYKKAVAAVHTLNEEYVSAVPDVTRHPLLREPTTKGPLPAPNRLKALPSSGSLTGGLPGAAAVNKRPATASHVSLTQNHSPSAPPFSWAGFGTPPTDGPNLPTFEDSQLQYDWRRPTEYRGDPFGPPSSYWGKPRSQREREFMIANEHLVPETEAQE